MPSPIKSGGKFGESMKPLVDRAVGWVLQQSTIPHCFCLPGEVIVYIYTYIFSTQTDPGRGKVPNGK